MSCQFEISRYSPGQAGIDADFSGFGGQQEQQAYKFPTSTGADPQALAING